MVTTIYKMYLHAYKICKHEIHAENLVPIDLLPLGGSISVLSEQKYVELNSNNLDYDATAALNKSADKFWVLILEITLKRKIMRSVIEYVAPSGLLVVVSWVTLFVP